MGEIVASAGMCAVGTAAAAATGEKIVIIVTAICNALLLLGNCVITLYRKWRDRDSDKQNKKDNGGGGDGETTDSDKKEG